MVFRRTVEDREWDKFKICEGETAVRTSPCGVQDVSLTGLNIEGLITETSVDDSSWTKLPATPLADRNAIAIQNQSAFEIKVNYSAVAGYVGSIVPSGGERFYDITDEIELYVRAESGAGTIAVLTEELS